MKYFDLDGNSFEIDEIKEREFLGRGKAAVVYKTIFDFKNKLENLALKDYRAYPLWLCPDTKRVFENYKAIKSLGLETWKIFLISEDKNKFLMENGNENGRLVGTFYNDNNGVFTKYFAKEENKIGNIPNFDSFSSKIFNDIKLLSISKIRITEDTYFFSFKENHNGESDLEYIFADFDNVKLNYNGENLFEKNIQSFLNAFREGLLPCLKEDKSDYYISEIEGTVNLLNK
ncbi:MAG: hypothetical protein PHG82_00770 [Candidatus Gracilibacteria bacterium]|nr:hypothetical protein [Candidatus Gracilibacteria bacterium]